jgi:hypothetical protein
MTNHVRLSPDSRSRLIDSLEAAAEDHAHGQLDRVKAVDLKRQKNEKN